MMGFEVYLKDNLERMLDRYAYTDDGKLLKQDAHGNWTEVPARKEYQVIPYNHTGQGEVW